MSYPVSRLGTVRARRFRPLPELTRAPYHSVTRREKMSLRFMKYQAAITVPGTRTRFLAWSAA